VPVKLVTVLFRFLLTIFLGSGGAVDNAHKGIGTLRKSPSKYMYIASTGWIRNSTPVRLEINTTNCRSVCVRRARNCFLTWGAVSFQQPPPCSAPSQRRCDVLHFVRVPLSSTPAYCIYIMYGMFDTAEIFFRYQLRRDFEPPHRSTVHHGT
jgi:hypothetical protein